MGQRNEGVKYYPEMGRRGAVGICLARSQGDRGINARGTPLEFMPRKPLDAWPSGAHFGAVGGDGLFIPTGCLTASAGSGAAPQGVGAVGSAMSAFYRP